jgi:hypothetical protein
MPLLSFIDSERQSSADGPQTFEFQKKAIPGRLNEVVLRFSCLQFAVAVIAVVLLPLLLFIVLERQ